MKLDPKIIEGKKPLGCFETEEAKKFIRKECYFADNECCFQSLDFEQWSSAGKGILENVSDIGSNAYRSCRNWYAYCLPCEWVQEQKKPQWRAFKDHAEYKEFLNDGIIESWVKIKDKGDNKIYELMYIGGGDDKICLGGMMLSVSNLFKDFELLNESTGEWQPFGVEEGEK